MLRGSAVVSRAGLAGTAAWLSAPCSRRRSSCSYRSGSPSRCRPLTPRRSRAASPPSDGAEPARTARRAAGRVGRRGPGRTPWRRPASAPSSSSHPRHAVARSPCPAAVEPPPRPPSKMPVHTVSLYACRSAIHDVTSSSTVVDTVRHLGVYFVSSRKLKCSLVHEKRLFYRSVNTVFGQVGRLPSEDVVLSRQHSSICC